MYDISNIKYHKACNCKLSTYLQHIILDIIVYRLLEFLSFPVSITNAKIHDVAKLDRSLLKSL